MRQHFTPRRPLLALTALAVSSVFVGAVEPPDSQLNAVSGAIEIAAPVWMGTRYGIDFVIQPPEDRRTVEPIAAHAADDLAPRMTGTSNGDAWVVWWRDLETDEVLLRHRVYATGEWDTERVVSETTQAARNPEIATDGGAIWIAYEGDGAAGTGIVARIITDEPDPLPIYDIATTSYGQDLDVQIHADTGHLWITWIDSDNEVAWSEYDHAQDAWGNVQYESYALDSPTDARERIRDSIVN